jgi:diacylglycerol kinase (ATP)
LEVVNLRPSLSPTSGPRDATGLARRAAETGSELVLVLGGDGTINEAAEGLIGTSVPLGVLPGGTANVLANELGLGNRIERAAVRLGRCVERRIAVGRLCDSTGCVRHFLLMGGAGLDATIVTKVHPGLKRRLGKLAYWLAGFPEFFKRVPQFEACVNGQRWRCGFALAARVRNYGGDLEIAGGASLLSGEFEVVLFEGSNPLRYIGYFIGVAVRAVQRLPGVHTVRARRIEFRGKAHVQMDGEYGGELPASMEIVPDALTLLMPEDYR